MPDSDEHNKIDSFGRSIRFDGSNVKTAGHLPAARALASRDRRALAGLAGLSIRTTQRTAASHGVVRGNVDTPTRLISALDAAGFDFIAAVVAIAGSGRGVRLLPAANKVAPVDERGRKGHT